jgi:serine protease Do
MRLLTSRTTFGVAGLLAGASLSALATTTPSYAFKVDPAPVPLAATATASTGKASLADLVERVSPSVVQIIVRQGSPVQRLSGPNDFDLPPGLRNFFGPGFQFRWDDDAPWQGRELPDRVGSGSGFFVERGYIVTNNHVVDRAKKLKVRLEDGTQVDANVVGTDDKTDLAVIKVDAKYARTPLRWGDSDRSRVGDNVFTIGAPFSLGNTVTAGVISARGRDINSGPYDDYFQIDAPINPGNSGGPMFNAAGEVIGVNTAIYSPSGGNVGIGFSIPSEQAQAVVRQIVDRGFVERGWLGVNIQRVTPEIARSFGLDEAKGALVAEVTPESPAAKAGLKPMDLITAYGDHPIGAMHDLTRAVADTKPGLSRELKIYRDGKERSVTVRIAALEAPDRPASGAGALTESNSKVSLEGGLGIQVAEDDQGRPVIADVSPNSPAEEAGLRAGDRLVMINQVKIASSQDARDAVAQAKKNGREAILVQIERNGSKLFVGVPLRI